MSSASSNGSEPLKRTIVLFREAIVEAYVKRMVALFAMIDVGVGFAGYLTISLLLSGEGILDVTLGFVLGMIVLLPVSCLWTALAAVITTQARTTLDRSLIQTSLICGASCYVGVFAMIVLSLMFIRGAFPPIIAVEFGFGCVFILSVATSIPAAIIAPGVAWIDHRYMSSQRDFRGGTMSGRRVKVTAAVILLCLLGGCLDVTMTTTVDSEAEIEQVRAEAEMSQKVYAMVLEDATPSGYESVGEQLADDLETNEDSFSDVEYEDRRENGTVVIELVAQEVDVEEVSYIMTTVTDNETVAFTASMNDDVADLNEYTYRVEITGTDAAEIEDESVAVWELHETNPERVYVESEVEDRSWLSTIALALGVIGVAMVGVAAYQMRVGESYV